jgi:hypothetical protein
MQNTNRSIMFANATGLEPWTAGNSDLVAGEYACVCYSKENAAAQSRKISKYCEKKGLSPKLMLQISC